MTDKRVSFAEYGKSFQEKIIQALIVDHAWARQVIEVLRVEYFEYRYLQFLADSFFEYYDKYKCFPSFDTLITLVRDRLKRDPDDILKDQILSYLTATKANPDVGDLPYVKDKTLDFCRKQEIRESLERIVDKVESADYDEIVDDLNRAVNKGTCESIGHDFSEDREARFVTSARYPIPTGIDELDGPMILRGGLGTGELGCVIAPTGVGKCVSPETYVDVMYEQIVVDGRAYDPWDDVVTQRGVVKAHELTPDDVLVAGDQVDDR